MAEVFEVRDRDGVPISLDQARWERHIVAGHGEVEPFIEEIKTVIQNPDLIYEHAGSRLYCKLGVVETPPYKPLYLEVVVRISGKPARGEVITVHFRKTPPSNGELIWMSKN
jgi:hypothetical protein